MQDKTTYFALALECNLPILEALYHTRCFASNPATPKEWNEFQLEFIRRINQLNPAIRTKVITIGFSPPKHGCLNMFRIDPSDWDIYPYYRFFMVWDFGPFHAWSETLKIVDLCCENISNVPKFNRDLHRRITLKTIHKSGIEFDSFTEFIQILFQLIREWWTTTYEVFAPPNNHSQVQN